MSGPLDKDRIISWSVLLLAVFFRFFALSLKPPHGDEGVNGFFVNQIWENGFFSYDPSNYHGPLLFYLFQISEKIFGFGILSFRIVTALFSLLTVWLALGLRDILGRRGSFFAALGLAVSPGMIFFGRSAIHEAVFVFFQVVWVAGAMRLMERADRRSLNWFVAGMTGCLLLKETFVVLAVSLLIAWAWAETSPWLLRKLGGAVEGPPKLSFGEMPGSSEAESTQQPARRGKAKQKKTESATDGPVNYIFADIDGRFIFRTFFVAALAWLLLFTGFLHHMSGAGDFFKALAPWLKTGVGGSGHNKPFSHWFLLFGQYEWVGLAGLAGAFIGLFSGSWNLRLLSCLAIVNGLIYSLIPYKTPWCIISILWPFVFIAGAWLESAFQKPLGRPALAVALIVIAGLAGRSAVKAYNLNFVHYSEASPYVYVQVKNDFKALESVISKKIRSAPDMQNMVIQSCLASESWPLPWVFSHFPNYRYGSTGDAFDVKADVILADANRNAPELSGLYVRRKTDLREARELMYVYLKKSTFEGIDLSDFEPVPSAPLGP